MKDALEKSVQPALLHIAGAAQFDLPEALAVEEWVTQAHLEVERCPDVYLGLARALRYSQLQCHAVVVGVEDLSPGEFEFFSVLARARRDLPVLVYGARVPDRVIRALEMGARGLATQEAILSLEARIQSRDQSDQSEEPAAVPIPAAAPPSPHRPRPFDFVKPSPVVEAAPTITVPTPPAHTEAPIVESKPTIAREDEVEDEPQDNASPIAAARVPWLRYSGGPARQRPGSANTEHKEPASADRIHNVDSANGKRLRECGSERVYEPLLTEQELAALLGDDLDDLSLQEREMLTGEGDAPGGAKR